MRRGVWRNPDFLLLISGQVVSYVGDQVQNLALPLLVLVVSGSTAQAGLVLGLHTVSFLLFGLVAGVLVDRWDRRTTMIWCEVGRGLLTVSIPAALWLGRLTLVQIYVVTVLTGILLTLFQTANTAAMPNVVGEEQLPRALGYTQSAFGTVRIFGASLAGALYGIGRTVPFAVNAASFVVSAATLRLMRVRFQERREGPPARMTNEIREGLVWLWRRPALRFLTGVQAADNLRYGAGFLVIVVLAKRVGATPPWIGVIFSGAAVGAIAGALVAARVSERFPPGRIAAAMLWVEAAVFPLYAFAPGPLSLSVVAAAESVIGPVFSLAMTTYRLSATPDELRGRVISATSTLTVGALSLGTIFGGMLLASVGPRTMVLISSLWLLFLAVLTTAYRGVRSGALSAESGVR